MVSNTLGLNVEEWGGVAFRWVLPSNPTAPHTIWTPFKDDTSYFAQHGKFHDNFRVQDLHVLVTALRAEGCDVDAKVDES